MRRAPNPLVWGAVVAALTRAPIAFAADAEAPTNTLQEVVVTASRREQSVLDVPYNISAVSSQSIENANVKDLQSLTRMVPGLVIPDLGPRANSSNSNIVIRGLNANDPSSSAFIPSAAVPLVSTYVDEVPLFVNLVTTDIARVEVLRGPQGTLYGSGAVGGTLRFIHNQPDTEKFSAQFNGSVANTDHAGKASYSADGILNIPLGSALAWRTSAGYRYIAGFIDAPRAVVFDRSGNLVLADPAHPLTSGPTYTSFEDVDRANVEYARTALLWKATEQVQATLAYQYQRERANGFTTETQGTDLEVERLIPNAPADRKVDLGSLTLTGDLGFATIVSSTSFSRNKEVEESDNSVFIEALNTPGRGAYPYAYGGYPRNVSPFLMQSEDQSFVEELRLVSKTGGDWDYVLGGYLQNQHQHAAQQQYVTGFSAWSELPGSGDAVNAAFGAPGLFPTFGDFIAYSGGTRPSELPTDFVFSFDRHFSFHDKALYGELTRHLNTRWQVTGGARVFWQSYDQNIYQVTPVCGPICSTLPVPDAMGTVRAAASEGFHDYVLKFNTSYEVAANTHLYATYSEGFRHGGSNATPVGNCNLCDNASLVPFKSDTAKNYEVGVKGKAGEWLRYTADVFRVNWKNIQTLVGGTSGDQLVENGGNARSQGIELELFGQLSRQLSGTLGYSLTDSRIQSDFTIIDSNAAHPGFVLVAAKAGDRLPAVPRNQLTASLDFLQPLANSRAVGLHLDASYRSSVTTGLNASASGYRVLGGFTTVGAGMTFQFTDRALARLHVSNLTNVRGITAGGNATLSTFVDRRYVSDYVSRPRTIELGMSYTFD